MEESAVKKYKTQDRQEPQDVELGFSRLVFEATKNSLE